MGEPLRFFAPGVPAPKGSTRAFVIKGRARVTHDNKRTKPWQSIVMDHAALAMQELGLEPWRDTALSLTCHFFLPRPSSHYAREGVLRKSAPRYPRVKPDLDKLTRLVSDSLEVICFDNDSRIVTIAAIKSYVVSAWGRRVFPGDRPGVAVLLKEYGVVEVKR